MNIPLAPDGTGSSGAAPTGGKTPPAETPPESGNPVPPLQPPPGPPADPATASAAQKPAPEPAAPPSSGQSGAASTSAESLTAALTGQLESLGSEFVTASEWGLFRDDRGGGAKDPLKERIITALNVARVAATAGDVPSFQTAYLEAKTALNQAEQSRPVWYLGNNRFGLLPLLFTVASAVLVYLIVFLWFLGYGTSELLHSPLFLGFAGAILKSLYWLQYQINKGLLRPRWFAYFLVAPLIGVLLGGLSALAMKVGFKFLETDLRQLALDWRVIGLFSAFAGFNWEWALDKIRYRADALAAAIAQKSNATTGANAAKSSVKDPGKSK